MRTDIIQKALVKNSKGEILLLRRSETDRRRPKQWDFPGGILDAGETLEEGVLREVYEETGLKANHPTPFFAKTNLETWTTQDDTEDSANAVRIYYFATIEEGEVTISFEHSEYCWTSLENALNLLEYDKHREVISYVIDNKLEL